VSDNSKSHFRGSTENL